MIGTPLMQPQSAAYVNPEAGEAKAANGMRIQLNGPRFGYMPHHEQISESAKVLEIGAMVVVAKDAGKRSVNEKGIETREEETDVWKLVGQMESQLKLQDVGDTEKGLRGCEMIREALADKECVVKKGGGGESGVQTDTAGE